MTAHHRPRRCTIPFLRQRVWNPHCHGEHSPAQRPRRGTAPGRVHGRAQALVWALGLVLLSALMALLASAPPAAAAGAARPPQAAGMLATSAITDLSTVVDNATAWLVGILATVATFFLTLGGLRYLSAGGDPAQVEQAKGSFKSAAIGYGLAVLAPLLLKTLQGILEVS